MCEIPSGLRLDQRPIVGLEVMDLIIHKYMYGPQIHVYCVGLSYYVHAPYKWVSSVDTAAGLGSIPQSPSVSSQYRLRTEKMTAGNCKDTP